MASLTFYPLRFSVLYVLLIVWGEWPSRGFGLPLWTESRWVVNEDRERVKLACVNWVASLEPAVAEGLSKQPVDVLSRRIRDMGFNCVRLTWPLYLVSNHSLANLSVQESFLKLGLAESVAGLEANNPSILHQSLINAFKAVVESLAHNKVMVILDNHLSKPGWCCSPLDGNGFFGDKYFDPNLWITGLTKMATLFNSNPYVIAMSLRNELRGPKQNTADWYKYIQQGAEAVHNANPNVLVILSGLTYDTNFTFLYNQRVNLTFTGKLVFEMHWYTFSDGQGGKTWRDGNPNEVCSQVVKNITKNAGFLLHKGYPLFVGEFGIDLRGIDVGQYRYFNCFLAWAAENDIDWALWTLVGSYYFREGVVGMNEYYGLLDSNWSELRNVSFLQRISIIQSPLRGFGRSKSSPYKIIFHPLTGLCVVRKSSSETMKLGNCSKSDHWNYTPQKLLTIWGTPLCLQAQGLNNQVQTSPICPTIGTKWQQISDSELHLATNMGSNDTLCLDVSSDHEIITTTCKCLGGDGTCDPSSQWFKLVEADNCVRSFALGNKSNSSPKGNITIGY